jgi:hypothetical protein
VEVSNELNGTTIACTDGLTTGSKIQNTTIIVLPAGKFWTVSSDLYLQYDCTGSPSSPNLTVAALDFQSFNFIISPLPVPSQCVLHYNITPTGSDGCVLPDITAVATENVGPITVTASGFDLCTDMYSFTAFAVTPVGASERSAVKTYSSPSEFGHTSNYNVHPYYFVMQILRQHQI